MKQENIKHLKKTMSKNFFLFKIIIIILIEDALYNHFCTTNVNLIIKHNFQRAKFLKIIMILYPYAAKISRNVL